MSENIYTLDTPLKMTIEYLFSLTMKILRENLILQ